MFENESSFISLSALSGRLSLPESFLKNLADEGKIPFLTVNGRRRFNPRAVDKALSLLAGGYVGKGDCDEQ